MLSGANNSSSAFSDASEEIIDNFTPERAVMQIQEVLEFALERIELIQELFEFASVEEEQSYYSYFQEVVDNFKLNFHLKEGRLRCLSFNVDELKEHVLKILVPAFKVYEASVNMRFKDTTVNEKLSNIAHSWPSQAQFEMSSIPQRPKPILYLQQANAAKRLPYPDIIKVQEISKSSDELKRSR